MGTINSKISLWLAAMCIPALLLGSSLASPVDSNLDGTPDIGFAARGGDCLISIPPASLLVDRAHSGDFDIGGLGDYLIGQGWTVDELTLPVTTDALAGYDVFLIPSNVGGLGEFPSIDPYTADEVEVVAAFVDEGKGLWCLSEYNHDPSGVNTVSSHFGVTFHADIIVDPVDNVDGSPGWPLIQTMEVHPITTGVSSFGYYAGCCVESQYPALVIATGGSHASSGNCPQQPPVLAVYHNGGRAVFCGDATPLYPGYGITDEHWLLLANTAEWLATGQVVEIESMGWSAVKNLYR